MTSPYFNALSVARLVVLYTRMYPMRGVDLMSATSGGERERKAVMGGGGGSDGGGGESDGGRRK